MSQVRVNTIVDANSGNTAQINGMTPTADSLQGFRNRIINGDMRIDQRNAGASVTPASSTYLVDRYQAVLSVASKLTFQQVSDAPAGFSNSLKVTVASQYNPSTSEQFVVRQAIEGFNAADLGLGTASATAITVSAWVKSSVAGTYALYLANGASNRGYVSTVSVTTSWTQVSFTLTGDTAGTWLTNNGIGLYLGVDLGCGSDFKAPSNNSWQAGDYKSATGAVVFVNQTATTSTFQITGVQLEAGSVATPFERRPYGTELMLCQRYLPAFRPTSIEPLGIGFCPNTTLIDVIVNFQVPARAPTTGITTSAANTFAQLMFADAITAVVLLTGGATATTVRFTTSGVAGAQANGVRSTGSSTFILFTGCEL
jgi:hypothetical protein